LQDIDLAPDAVGADPVMTAAWDAKGFSHYTGVSRGIRRADARTVSELQATLEKVSAPFLARDREEALATGRPLRLEGDTTGLGTTADMPGVEPGLIEGRLQPGFRMASVSLRTPFYRVMLGSAHFNGKRVACQTIETLISLAERRIGRPRRRVELLHAQLEDLKQKEAHWREKAQRAQARAQQHEQRAWELHFLLRQTEGELKRLEAQYAGREIKPYSRLAQARRHRQTYQRWQASARRRQQQAQEIAQRFAKRATTVWGAATHPPRTHCALRARESQQSAASGDRFQLGRWVWHAEQRHLADRVGV
jgi:hypothetical protein